MARDSQRRKLERVERSIFSWNTEPLSPEGAALVLAAIVKTRWFKKRWPEAAALGIVVEENPSKRIKINRCRFNAKLAQTEMFHTLQLDQARMTRLALLHALVHVVSGSELHDRSFVRVYVLLVNRFLGKDSARELVSALKRERVSYRRKPRYSEETLRRLKERFEVYRKRPRRAAASGEGFAGEE